MDFGCRAISGMAGEQHSVRSMIDQTNKMDEATRSRGWAFAANLLPSIRRHVHYLLPSYSNMKYSPLQSKCAVVQLDPSCHWRSAVPTWFIGGRGGRLHPCIIQVTLLARFYFPPSSLPLLPTLDRGLWEPMTLSRTLFM